MADTQRTRAALISLMADNVTGQISAQDFRDFIVTVMEPEFANPGDFWKQPDVTQRITDASITGWKLYSQTIGSAVSFGNVLFMNTSGTWMRADVAASGKTVLLGVAGDSYASDATTGIVLRKGLVVDSSLSATFSGFIGRPIYLDSGVPGSISVGITGNSVKIAGYIVGSAAGDSNIGKWFFDPEDWAVKGS